MLFEGQNADLEQNFISLTINFGEFRIGHWETL